MTTTARPDSVAAKLSTLDRLLPAWLGLAMAGGLLLGRPIPDLVTARERIEVDTVPLPIAIAISIAWFGVTSGQVHAGTFGPVIEVPARRPRARLAVGEATVPSRHHHRVRHAPLGAPA